jgi:hypothetical protein
MTALMYLIYGVVWLILLPVRALPDAVLPTQLTVAIATVGQYIALLNKMLGTTTTTLLFMIGFLMTIETAILSYKFIMWCIRKIPGIS